MGEGGRRAFWTREPYQLALRALFWVVCIGVFTFALARSKPIVAATLTTLMPFLLGLVVAYILHPIVLFVQHKLKLGRVTGIIVVAAIIAVAVGVFLAVLLPLLFSQVDALLDALKDYFKTDSAKNSLYAKIPEETRKKLEEFLAKSLEQMKANLGVILEGQSGLIGPVASGSLDALSAALHGAMAIFGWVGAAAATIGLTLIATFYYLMEMSKIPAVIRRLLPGHNRERIWEVILLANQSVGGFLRGQLIACIGVGILTTLLMLAVGPRKYAILIGFIAGSVNFVPYLGPAFGATPAALWALFGPGFESWGDRGLSVALILGGFGLIQAIDGLVFQPFIVGKQAALHPLAVMAALLIGAQFGVGGMVIAVPIACVVKVLWVELYWKKRSDFLELPELIPDARDAATADRPPEA